MQKILLPEGEEAKGLAHAAYCWEKLAAWGANKATLLIALGGGTVSDLAGFVAACYMRGLDWIAIPTTLMAMIDASIGGKNALNFAECKNLIGTFHLPKLIWIDPTCLQTLSQREFRAGLAEAIKYGMIHSPELFAWLENNMAALLERQTDALAHMIAHSVAIKTAIVQQDPLDCLRIRAKLNYGHTFAHAIESLTKKYVHGEAVAIGMNCAAHLAWIMQKTDRALIARQAALCQQAGLPIALPNLPKDHIIAKMGLDKKSLGKHISCILPEKIGQVQQVTGIAPDLIAEALQLAAHKI
jgi:3-dehydroquinate synthase